jgi:hypothetical protein
VSIIIIRSRQNIQNTQHIPYASWLISTSKDSIQHLQSVLRLTLCRQALSKLASTVKIPADRALPGYFLQLIVVQVDRADGVQPVERAPSDAAVKVSINPNQDGFVHIFKKPYLMAC